MQLDGDEDLQRALLNPMSVRELEGAGIAGRRRGAAWCAEIGREQRCAGKGDGNGRIIELGREPVQCESCDGRRSRAVVIGARKTRGGR